jgi:hypothetical protein
MIFINLYNRSGRISPRSFSAYIGNEYHKEKHDVRFEVFTAVTLKNALFWVIMSSGSYKNRRLGGIQHLHHQSDKNR